MTKKRPSPDDKGHQMGNRCGYTKMADGRIIPAPAYSDRFEKCSVERGGINDLMKLFTSHCADLLAEIGRRQRRVWDEMCEDYGIDTEVSEATYDGTYVTITPKPKPKEDAAPSPLPTSGKSK